MNIEKYTERVRGFIQSAQSLAVREGHQQFSPLHILKVLLDDSEGLAGSLIDRAGGNSRAIDVMRRTRQRHASFLKAVHAIRNRQRLIDILFDDDDRHTT